MQVFFFLIYHWKRLLFLSRFISYSCLPYEWKQSMRSSLDQSPTASNILYEYQYFPVIKCAAFNECSYIFIAYICILHGKAFIRFCVFYHLADFTLLFITAVRCENIFIPLYTLKSFYKALIDTGVKRHFALCSWMLPHQCDTSCQTCDCQ